MALTLGPVHRGPRAGEVIHFCAIAMAHENSLFDIVVICTNFIKPVWGNQLYSLTNECFKGCF